MDEERKKGITVVVGSTERHSKSMLVAALSKIDGVNALELGKDHLTISPSLIKEIDDSLAVKSSGLLPGLGFGLLTDASGIPLDLRNSNRPLARYTVGRHRKRRRK